MGETEDAGQARRPSAAPARTKPAGLDEAVAPATRSGDTRRRTTDFADVDAVMAPEAPGTTAPTARGTAAETAMNRTSRPSAVPTTSRAGGSAVSAGPGPKPLPRQEGQGSPDENSVDGSIVVRVRSRHRVTAVVVLAVVLQMVPRIYGALGGWFFADDFWRQDWVTRQPPWDIAMLGQGGHLAPVSFLLTYGFTALTPFNWTAQVIATAVLWLVADLLVLAAFRALWGWGWPTAVAFAVFALSTLTAPSFLWSNQVWLGWAAVTALALLLVSTIRAIRVRSLPRDLLAWSALAVGLLMAERTAVEALAVALMLVVAFAPAHGGARAFLRRTWRLYAGSAVVLTTYAAVYLALVPRVQDDPLLATSPTTRNLLPAVAEGLQQAVGPGLLGGPWWLDDAAVTPHASVPGIPAFLALQTVVLLLVGIVIVRRRGWPAVALLVGITLATVLMIAISRSGPGGLLIMHDFRYYANLAVWFPLLTVLSLVPPGDPEDGTWPASFPEVVRASAVRHPVVWALLAVVLVDGALITTGQTAERFRTSTSREYLERTLADLDQLGPVTIADRQLPPTVVPALLTRQTLASRVLSAAEPRPSFDVPAERLYWLSDDGSIVPAALVGGPTTLPGLDGACGTAIQPGSSRVLVLTSRLFDWNWWARVDYLAQRDTTLTLDAGRTAVQVPVHEGTGSVYVPVSGPVDQAEISAPAGGGGVCVAGVQVGAAGPRQAGG